MRIASVAASLLLAVCISVPALISSSVAASDQQPGGAPVQAHPGKRAAHVPAKPTWDQCFEMSINRGFNHDAEEWHQSIIDCMDGKIPL